MLRSIRKALFNKVLFQGSFVIRKQKVIFLYQKNLIINSLENIEELTTHK